MDFAVEDNGSIVLVTPTNETARKHLEFNAQEDAQWWGKSLVVEAKFAPELLKGLENAGYSVS